MKRINSKSHFLSLALTFLLSCGLLSPADKYESLVTVRVLDVGQGLSVLISDQNKNDILYDAGPPDSAEALVRKLDSLHIDTIETFVLSHPDADHYGGFFAVAKLFPIRRILWVNLWPYRPANEGIAMFCDSMRIPQKPLRAGDTIMEIDDARIECLWPIRGFSDWGRDSTNGQSIVLRGTVGETSFLLPGDLPSWAESLLVIQEIELKSRLLVAGHHGSKNSSSITWLAAVSPEIVAISSGAHNSYGHPAPEMLARVAAVGCTEVLRTDSLGDLIFQTNGWGWAIQ